MSITYANIPAMGPGIRGGNNANQYAFDLNVLGNELRFDVRAYSVCTVSAIPATAWATATLGVYRSPDGVSIFALEAAEVLGPGADMTATLDTNGIDYLIVRNTLVEGSQKFASVYVKGKVSNP